MAQLKDLVVNGNSRLIGDSMAQTPAAGTNNQEIATTAFVKKAVDDAISQNPATLSAAASVTTAPAVTVSKDTNMSTASSGTYYVNVTVSESNGVAKADAGVSKSGFATNQTASKTCTVDPAVTNSAGKFYIPSTSITMADLGGGGDVGIDIYEVASGSQDANVTLSKVDIGSKDTTNYPYYFKVGAAGTTKSVTSGAVTATDGYIAASTPIASGAKSKSVTATERVEYVKLQAGAVTEAGGGLSQGTASGGDLSGGDLSGGGLSGGGLSAGSGEVSLTAGSGAASAGGNITLGTAQSTAPTTGYYISATGSGTVSAKGRGSVNRAAINRAAVSRAAVTRATFSRPVTRAAVTDTRTEGWIPTRSATTVIAAATETVTLAAGTLSAGSIAADSIAAGSGTSNWSDSSSLSSNSKTVYYPIATANCSHSGGGLSKGDPSGGGLTGGTLTAGNGSASVTTTPVVTPKISGTVISTGTTSYGITTTKPSGTDGTNFLTLDPDGTVTTTGVASGKGTVNRASVTRAAFSQTVSHATVTCTHSEGWQTAGSHTAEAADSTTVSLGADSTTIGATSATSNAATCSITPSVAAGTNYYMPIVSPAFTGGGTSVTIPPVVSPPTVEYHETGTFVSSTYTPTYGITTTKPSGTDGTNYLTVDATHTENNGSVSGSANITRNAVTYNGAAKGAISKVSGTTALASSSSSGTGSITTTAIDPTVTDNFEPYYVPIVTANATGGTASADAAAGVASASVVGMATTTVNTGYYVSASATGGNANASATGGSASVGKGITAGKTVSGADASDSKTGSTASTAIYIVAGACTVAGGGLSKGTASGGGLSGGGLSAGNGEVSLTAGSGYASLSSSSNVTFSDTNNGISVTATGSGSVTGKGRGSVNRAAVTRAAFSQAVTRANITDAHTAGYIPAKSATTVISAATETVSLAADSTTIGSTSGTSNWSTDSSKSSNSATATKYITGITVPKDVPFSVTTTDDTALDDTSTLHIINNAYRKSSVSNYANANTFINNAVNGYSQITNPAGSSLESTYSAVILNKAYRKAKTQNEVNGYSHILNIAGTSLDSSYSATIENRAYRKAYINNLANASLSADNYGTANIYNAGTTTLSTSSAIAGSLTVSAYNSSGSAENNKSVVSNGKWVSTTATSSGTYYGRTTVTTQTKTATANGTITPDSGKLLSSVTVSVPSPSAVTWNTNEITVSSTSSYPKMVTTAGTASTSSYLSDLKVLPSKSMNTIYVGNPSTDSGENSSYISTLTLDARANDAYIGTLKMKAPSTKSIECGLCAYINGIDMEYYDDSSGTQRTGAYIGNIITSNFDIEGGEAEEPAVYFARYSGHEYMGKVFLGGDSTSSGSTSTLVDVVYNCGYINSETNVSGAHISSFYNRGQITNLYNYGTITRNYKYYGASVTEDTRWYTAASTYDILSRSNVDAHVSMNAYKSQTYSGTSASVYLRAGAGSALKSTAMWENSNNTITSTNYISTSYSGASGTYGRMSGTTAEPNKVMMIVKNTSGNAVNLYASTSTTVSSSDTYISVPAYGVALVRARRNSTSSSEPVEIVLELLT